MSEIVVEEIDTLVTEIGESPEQDMYLRIVDESIDAVSSEFQPHWTPDKTVDGRDLLVMPGLVNTHHHFIQTLNRNIPAVQNAKLFDWLKYLYEVWKYLTPEMARIAAQVASAELIRSGCTTAVDHFYLFPNDHQHELLEAEIEAVREIGLRFHPTRGSMSLSRKDGGLPPESVVQDEHTILRHTRDIIEDYHEPGPNGMTRVIVAPCSPFTVTDTLMTKSKELGMEYEKVYFHTHLAETVDEENYCLEATGKRPFEYLEALDWMDDRCFFAHSVHLNRDELNRMAETGAAVSHCPTSNMRLGSGMAPVVDMLERGITVSLGVDGSASNDSSHMFAEARQALLLQRVNYTEDSITARDVLRAATLGGARAIGRQDIGVLEPGMAADLIGIDMNQLDFAGAQHDPLGALVFCHPPKVDLSIINGDIKIRDGDFLPLDLSDLVQHQNELAEKQIQKL